MATKKWNDVLNTGLPEELFMRIVALLAQTLDNCCGLKPFTPKELAGHIRLMTDLENQYGRDCLRAAFIDPTYKPFWTKIPRLLGHLSNDFPDQDKALRCFERFYKERDALLAQANIHAARKKKPKAWTFIGDDQLAQGYTTASYCLVITSKDIRHIRAMRGIVMAHPFVQHTGTPVSDMCVWSEDPEGLNNWADGGCADATQPEYPQPDSQDLVVYRDGFFVRALNDGGCAYETEELPFKSALWKAALRHFSLSSQGKKVSAH